MTADRTPVVVAALRTPVGTAGGALARFEAASLAAPVLRRLRARLDEAGLASLRVDDVVLGNCCGPGGDVARVAALAAGLGPQVPGLTVDRQCGSGLEAVRIAATSVLAGHADLVLAGGTESASSSGDRPRAPFAPPGVPDPDMGPAADAVARTRRITRERQDAYAARSHARAVAAAARGAFDAELVPVGGVRRDERPRPRLTAAVLARFRPAFGDGGTATAGNSCGISDGAAALAVVPEHVRAGAGLPGLRVLASAVVGVDPALPGLGAAPAARAVLDRAGRTVGELDRLEVTEAFASQLLACTDELGLDPLDAGGADDARVCPDGGAIALGHPWGASGALLVVRLFHGLLGGPHPRPGRLGLAACAVGGGQGVAVLVETCA